MIVFTNLTSDLCPPMVGSEPWWQHTIATIPFARDVGTTITYEWIGGYFKEGLEYGPRTVAGSATCEAGPIPQWSRSIYLPCNSKFFRSPWCLPGKTIQKVFEYMTECVWRFVANRREERLVQFSLEFIGSGNKWLELLLRSKVFTQSLKFSK